MIHNQENCQKPHSGPNEDHLSPNSDHQFFFSKVWLHQSLDIMVSYHHVQYQKKLIDSILSDGRTGRQRDKSDFIGYCQKNTEHPIFKAKS